MLSLEQHHRLEIGLVLHGESTAALLLAVQLLANTHGLVRYLFKLSWID